MLSTCTHYWTFERCPHCGQTKTFCGDPSIGRAEAHHWYWHHRCVRNNGQEFYSRYLGETCGVCQEIVTDPTTIRAIDKRPVHIDCRFCLICLKYEVDPMRWETSFNLPEKAPRGLYHRECVLTVHGEQALIDHRDSPLTKKELARRRKAARMKRTPSGKFAPFEVPSQAFRPTRTRGGEDEPTPPNSFSR